MQPFWDLIYPLVSNPFGILFVTLLIPHVTALTFLAMYKGYFPVVDKFNLRRNNFQVHWENMVNPIMDNLLANAGLLLALTFVFYMDIFSMYQMTPIAPTLFQYLKELSILLCIWEVIVYPAHRFQHIPFWYRNFHSRHHQGVSWAYTVMSGNLIDEMISGTAIATPFLLYNCHPLSVLTYLSYFTSYGVAAHAGFEFPFCKFHFIHHMDTTCNYGGMTKFMDVIFGTYKDKNFSNSQKTEQNIQNTPVESS